MKRKRLNIRVPGSFLAVLWVTGIVIVYFTLVSAVHLKQEWTVRKTAVTFVSGVDQQHMLVESDIEAILVEYFGSNLVNVPVKHVETDLVEELIATSDYVEDAEVFVDKKNVLHIHIDEKVPAWRVYQGETSFYLDTEGRQMPLSANYTARVPVLMNHYAGEEQYSLDKAMEIWNQMNTNTFYAALIDQVEISREGLISFRPTIGKERVELGSMSDLDEQLEKYAAFYSQYMAEQGWNLYDRVNLTVPGSVRGFKKS